MKGSSMEKKNRIKTSFTLQRKIKSLIVILSEKFAISQTAVVSMAIIKLAETELPQEKEDCLGAARSDTV
jgi:hypothetical protein